MLDNALAMLVHKTRNLLPRLDVPMSYLYKSGRPETGEELWTIIVQRLPKQEAIAA